jgi:type I restriction enzyme, S subunit
MKALAPPRSALGFAIPRAKLSVRADVNYARMEPTVADLLRRFRHPLSRLGDLTSKVQYGSSSKAVEEPIGTPMLRMTNLQDGDWDLDVLKYTTLDEDDQQDLVGKCAVFRETGAWIYASYVIRVRIKDQESYLPEFLARFLNSAVGRPQIDRLSRQALMTNINSEEIKELMVPHPDPGVQKEMVAELNTHWDRYRERMKEMRNLLTQGDQEIAHRLGLEPPPLTNPMSWAIQQKGLVSGGRLNAEFFHPERLLTARAILEGDHPAHPLDQIASFVKDKQDGIKLSDSYLGLANVERDTGELLPAADEEDLPSGSVVRFKVGDVLFGKLRPYLNKVHLADFDGVCSPEFFVLRPREGVRGEYLAAILRSRLTLTQTKHMAGGNTHPRLTPADVHAMYIPVPTDRAIQDAIADAEAESRVEARTLKAQADEEWILAKQRFGDDLV